MLGAAGLVNPNAKSMLICIEGFDHFAEFLPNETGDGSKIMLYMRDIKEGDRQYLLVHIKMVPRRRTDIHVAPNYFGS
jgi:hypothetical protein